MISTCVFSQEEPEEGVVVMKNPRHASDLDDEEEYVSKLISICLKNPEFEPSSIDNFDPESASELEKEYYSIAQKLHKKGALSYVVQKRKEASEQRMVNCIQVVLETWPG
jgi:hypothetical protein